MKSAQWIAVLVLALMVGGITFVSVYLGNSSNNSAEVAPTATPTLTFAIKAYPTAGSKPQVTEVGQRGYQDYWFVNENRQDVTVTLLEKGCTCSEVEITLAPESWRTLIFGTAAANLLRLPPRGWNDVTTTVATQDYDHLYPEMPDYDGKPTVLNKQESFVVPALAMGRVRLSWRQPEPKALLTYAGLWMGPRDGGSGARLDAGVKITPPLDADKELAVAAMDLRELEKLPEGQETSLYCWSLTRRSFRIEATVVRDRTQRLQAESDPIEVGRPIPLNAGEMRQLEKKDPHVMTVLSGYRIPVKIRATARDGTPIEWGFFNRYVQLSSPDAAIEGVQVRLQGEVRGDVSVGSGKGAGAIHLGPFSRNSGKSETILLRSEEEKLDLELDAKRLPEFLKATLDAAETTPGGTRLWKLHVEVPARTARGEFPRADNPDYRDSAIYVKTKEATPGKPSRTIRIPVMGVAIER